MLEDLQEHITNLVCECKMLEQQLKKKDEVINKAIKFIEKAQLGEFPDGVIYWLKDDEVGKNLLQILEDKGE